MIIKNVCLLLEALSIVICLHHLYGEKFKLDIATVSYLSIHMIVMVAINYLGLPKTYTMIMYSIFIVYCGVRFGFQVRKLAINIVLCIILVAIIQMGLGLGITYFGRSVIFGDLRSLVTNILALLITIFVLPLCKIGNISFYIKDKGKILMLTIGICIVIVLYMIIDYKKIGVLDLEPLILLFVSIIFIFVLSGQLNKYKVKAKEVETELRMQKVYADSFKGMIDDIRMRQHEFNNHISMLHSLHLNYHTYEELAGALDSYGDAVMKENRFYRLLSGGNSVIAGFLYGRFNEFCKEGIEVSYQVIVQDLEVGVPCYKIVEILGDLMNNAAEALLAGGGRNRMHVSVIEGGGFWIEVRNESPYISYKELGAFWEKGYSRKGEGRGLGLYNVKQTCDEYGLEIACDNVEIDGENWLSFTIRKEKETA